LNIAPLFIVRLSSASGEEQSRPLMEIVVARGRMGTRGACRFQGAPKVRCQGVAGGKSGRGTAEGAAAARHRLTD